MSLRRRVLRSWRRISAIEVWHVDVDDQIETRAARSSQAVLTPSWAMQQRMPAAGGALATRHVSSALSSSQGHLPQDGRGALYCSDGEAHHRGADRGRPPDGTLHAQYVDQGQEFFAATGRRQNPCPVRRAPVRLRIAGESDDRRLRSRGERAAVMITTQRGP